nr:MAG TPA: minor capsid protein [Bacteriophage sp.]
MNRTRELIRQYEQAETEIRKEIEKEPEGNRGEYAKKLLASISAILAGLYVATETWSGNNVPRIYNEGVQQAQRGVNAQYKAAGMKPPDIGKMTSADFDAVSVLQRNLNADLTNAVDYVGRMMEDEIRKAGLHASLEKVSSGRTVKQMQRSLVQMLEEKGIAAIEYMRGGKKCYMSLSAYAKLVARSTVHEARNTANINLGARIGNDLVKMSSHFGSCPICEPYQGRVFSVSGTNPNYPALYDTPWSSAYQNFHPHCRHILTQYIEELQSDEDIQNMRKYSNRAFDIGGKGWTKEQTAQANKSLANYRAGRDRKTKLYIDRKQWQNYRAVLGDDAPKSFSGFRRMKQSGNDKWQYTQLDYRRRKKLIDNPKLALPNVEAATAADAKFTKYLFNKNNADGWAKGRAFESRLGYNISNWEELQRQLIDRARLYPAKAGETDQYGTRYTQYMVLYGNKGKPANVRAGWKVSEDKTWLATVLIKEVD